MILIVARLSQREDPWGIGLMVCMLDDVVV